MKHLEEQQFLPNFCGIRSVFALVIVGELFVFVLVLALPQNVDWLNQLSLMSLFVQWVGLGSAAFLCMGRKWLGHLKVVDAAMVSYLIVLFVTLVASEVAFWTVHSNPEWGTKHYSFVMRNLAISSIVSAVALRYLFLQHQLRRQYLAEARARVQALQARIRPHFLFNSMNTIAALVRAQPDVAEETVEDLADLFRVSLSANERKHTLGAELEMARRYLRIEKLRLGDRIRLEWEIGDAPMDAFVPPVTLQPLLENAVYHGIEPRIDGGLIQLSVRRHANEIIIVVSNTIPEGNVEKTRKGNSMAVGNIKERLELFYETPGKMMTLDDGNHFTVEIRIPYVKLD